MEKKRMALITQTDALTLVAEYAEKFPINAGDTYTRSVGTILRELMIDILNNVPVTAWIDKAEREGE